MLDPIEVDCVIGDLVFEVDLVRVFFHVGSLGLGYRRVLFGVSTFFSNAQNKLLD